MKRIKIEALVSDRALFAEFAESMQNGAVAIIPTDTLYGFAADSSSVKAVQRIYNIKGRNEQKPFILFLNQIERLKEVKINIPETWAKELFKLWPGAITAVVECDVKSEALKAFKFSSLGVRIPNHQKLLSLLDLYKGYFLTTSANRSDQENIFDPDELQKEFAAEVDWLIDDGVLNSSKASTVVKLLNEKAFVLRQGAVKFDTK